MGWQRFKTSNFSMSQTADPHILFVYIFFVDNLCIKYEHLVNKIILMQ